VAHPQVVLVTRPQRGQVLVFFALLLPIILLPVAAYSVDAAVAGVRIAGLQEATAHAAEEAAQQISEASLRAGARPVLDLQAAAAMARLTVSVSEPGASVDAVAVSGREVDVHAHELVTLPLTFIGSPALTIRASASARLTLGYDSPSSLLPLPVSSF
jgi:hypothetical protein